MSEIRAGLGRHRGVITAPAVVALAGLVWAWSTLNAPTMSWAEPPRGPTAGDDWKVLRFSPDGRSLLAWNHEGARVRDLTTGRVVELAVDESRRTLHETPFVDFLAGGRLVAGQVNEADPSGQVRYAFVAWETATGRVVRRFPEIGLPSATPTIAVSADGSTVAIKVGSTGASRVIVWDAAGEAEPREFPSWGEQVVSLSAHGGRMATSGVDPAKPEVVVWDVASGRSAARVPLGSPNDLGPLTLSPDGRTLAIGLRKGTMVVDLADPTRRQVVDELEYDQARFSADGSALLLGVPSSPEQDAQIWDLAARPPRRVFLGQVGAVSDDGRRVVLIEANKDLPYEPSRGYFGVVEVPSMKRLAQARKGDRFFALGPGGRTLAVVTHRLDQAWYNRFEARKPPPQRYFPMKLYQVSTVRVIETESGRPIASLDIADRAPYLYPAPSADYDQNSWVEYRPLVALAPDGRSLAIHHPDRSKVIRTPGHVPRVEIWDLSPHPWRWPIAGALILLAAGVGRWSDLRERRPEPSAATP